MLCTLIIAMAMAAVCDARDGQWSTWMSWSRCTGTCGGGVQLRWRECNSPAPDDLGAYCRGQGQATKSCNVRACPVPATDGGWTVWSGWTKCTTTCDGGLQMRERSCTNPSTGDGGLYCVGDSKDVRQCKTEKCPTLGSESATFSVKLTSEFSSVSDGMVVVPFDGTIYNNGGYYHFNDHAYHAPTKGVYWFSFAGVSLYKNAVDIHLWTQKAGKTRVHVARAVAKGVDSYNNAAASVAVAMDRGETASVMMWGHGKLFVGAEYRGHSTYFSGMLVQKLE